MKAEEILYKHMITWLKTRDNAISVQPFDEFLNSPLIKDGFAVTAMEEYAQLKNSTVINLAELNRPEWVNHLGKAVVFGFEGREKRGIVSGYHPQYGVVLFVPSNVMIPYHYVREDLIEWSDEAARQAPELHPDSLGLIQDFSQSLIEKMAANEKKYGWTNEWLLQDWEVECQENLLKHLEKGDPKDVAIYAAFMWKRGWSTKGVGETGQQISVREVKEDCIQLDKYLGDTYDFVDGNWYWKDDEDGDCPLSTYQVLKNFHKQCREFA